MPKSGRLVTSCDDGSTKSSLFDGSNESSSPQFRQVVRLMIPTNAPSASVAVISLPQPLQATLTSNKHITTSVKKVIRKYHNNDTLSNKTGNNKFVDQPAHTAQCHGREHQPR